MIRAGVFILLMAIIGWLMNWNDNRGGELPYREGEFEQMQMILAVFAVAGLAMIGFGYWKKKR